MTNTLVTSALWVSIAAALSMAGATIIRLFTLSAHQWASAALAAAN